MNAGVINERQMKKHRRGWRFWFSRFLLGSVVAISALVGASVLYELLMRGGDGARFPTPGQIVMINGMDMHIHCVGDGEVTIVLESGANAYSDDWAVVQPQLGELSRTCTYDRAGLGWSALGGDDPTPEVIARNLHGLLAGADITPPYILVGHSAGGASIRMFTALYPDEVAGLVFVDARHESLDPLNRSEAQNLADREAYESSLNLYRILRDLGIARLFGLPLGRSVNPALNHYPDNVAYRMVLFSVRETTLQTMIRESRASTASNDALRSAAVPDGLPVYVLTAEDSLANDGWESGQDQLASLSVNSVWQTVTNSDHSLHATHPQVIVDAVRRVMTASRSGTALSAEGQE